MPTVSTFANGETLTSSALTLPQINTLVQGVICQILGLNPGVVCQVTITAGSAVVVVDDSSLLTVGMAIATPGIALNTISSIDGLNVTLSTAQLVTGTFTLAFGADANAYQKVRVGWQQEGEPAWTIGEDIVTVELSLIDDQYNRVRNSRYAQNDDSSLENSVTFTRAWDFSFSLYGPNAVDSARLIRSAMFLDWVHDLFIVQNLAMVPDLKEAVVLRENKDGQWWLRADFSITFYEGIIETITVPSIESVDILLESSGGVIGGVIAPNIVQIISVGSDS